MEVTAEDIGRLSDAQLVALLDRLLQMELSGLGLGPLAQHVSLAVDLPDGGEDGRVEWIGGPTPPPECLIPGRLTCIQAKAKQLAPAKCAQEVTLAVQGGVPTLKPQVDAVLRRGGVYLLVLTQKCSKRMLEMRATAISRVFGQADPTWGAPDRVRVYDATVLVKWCARHPAAQLQVRAFLGKAGLGWMQPWKEWETETLADEPPPLQWRADPARSELLGQLRDLLAAGQRMVRVVAAPGTGKTRLMLEALRPNLEIPLGGALSASTLYCKDTALYQAKCLETIRDVVREGSHAVFVLDECPIAIHEALRPIVRTAGAQLSVVTLDYEVQSRPTGAEPHLELGPLGRDTLRDALLASSPGLPRHSADWIAETSDGNPRIAQLLLNAASRGEPLWDVNSRELADRMLAGRQPPSELVRDVARVLALFEHLGIDGDPAWQLEEVRAKFLEGYTELQVRRAIGELRSRKVAYIRGDYARITPLLLGTKLAAAWWDDCPADLAGELLTGRLLPQLTDVLIRQLTRLGGHERVERLVEAALGDASPFAHWESVSTEAGSHALSCLAELAPGQTVRCLYGVLRATSKEDLHAAGEGRRNLVRCLEKLAWWPDCFERAAEMLGWLAAAENEDWANNASGALKQLFHPWLSGTETPAMQRLIAADRLIASEDAERRRVAMEALGDAFNTHSSRLGGVEVQGGRMPRADWRPRTLTQLHEYWMAVTERIASALVGGAMGSLLRQSIAERTVGMLNHRASGVIRRMQEVVVTEGRMLWPELLGGLRTYLSLNADGLEAAWRREVEDLIERMMPTTLEGRLQVVVSVPTWHEFRQDEERGARPMAEQRAIGLAREFTANVAALRPHLRQLLTGEQRQAWVFGEALGHAAGGGELLWECLDLLRLLPQEERNPALAVGLAKGWTDGNAGRVDELLERVEGDPDLRWLTLRLLEALDLGDAGLQRLVRGLQTGTIDVDPRYLWSFMRVTRGARVTSTLAVAEALMQTGRVGAMVAFKLIGLELRDHPDEVGLQQMCARMLASAELTRAALAEYDTGYDYLDMYKRAIALGASSDFVCGTMRTILEMVAEDKAPSYRGPTGGVLRIALRAGGAAAWNLLGADLLEGSDGAHFWLTHGLRYGDISAGDASGTPLLHEVPTDVLLGWARSNAAGPRALAASAQPLRESRGSGTYPSWTDHAVMLLTAFGDRREVLDELAGNLWSFGWSGSAVPALEARRVAFAELEQHPREAVREWAREGAEIASARILAEQKRDEEQEFGIR